MASAARTPEELEALFEDACILEDVAALRRLLDAQAVGSGRTLLAVRRHEAEPGTSLWAEERSLLVKPRLVLQAGDTALSVGGSINVMRRGSDHGWRYLICTVPTSEGDRDDPSPP